MSYWVKDQNGNILAVASRKEDAEAMTQTVGSEPKLIIEEKK